MGLLLWVLVPPANPAAVTNVMQQVSKMLQLVVRL